jgi:hypothetical protein
MRRSIGFFSVMAALSLAGCIDLTGLEQLNELCLSPCGGYGGPSGGGFPPFPASDDPPPRPPPPPSSDIIAFSSDRDGQYEIYVMNADGTSVWRVTDNPAFDTSASWRP